MTSELSADRHRSASERACDLLEAHLAAIERELERCRRLVDERAALLEAIAALDPASGEPRRALQQAKHTRRDGERRYGDDALVAALQRCAVDYQADVSGGRLRLHSTMTGTAPGETYYAGWRERQPDRDRLPSTALFMRRDTWTSWARRAGLEPNKGLYAAYRPRYDDAAMLAALRRCIADYQADVRAGRVLIRGRTSTTRPSASYYTAWRERQPDRDALPSGALFVLRGGRKWTAWTDRAGAGAESPRAPRLG